MREEGIVATSTRHVAEVRGINRQLIEKALRMRCLSHLAHVKSELLTDTIYEMKRSKVALRGEITAHERAKSELQKHQTQLEELVDARTGELKEANRKLEQEIAEKRRLEAQFVQAQKMEAVGTLAGGIAHDFNNLLTGVLGSVDAVLLDLPPGSDAAEHLSVAREAAERAGELTAQLMDLSRREEAQMEPVDPNEAVRQISALLRHSIPQRIEIDLALDDTAPRIQAAPGRLAQVLLNLSINARDAMPDGGRLVFETQACTIDEEYVRRQTDAHAGRFVRIAVRDSGVGISEKTLPRIFEPFYTTKERGQGTGLGLAMVYGCVKAHGGWIHVYSEEGLGATFSLYFPVAEEEAYIAAWDEALPTGTETVLLVDDSDAVRLHARSVLEGCGYRVVAASDGVEALQRFAEREGEIAVVVTDLVMPGCGGRELLAAVRGRGSDVPFVLISGYGSKEREHSERMREQGFADILAKPLEARDLAAIVRRVLDAR